jgi:Sec-independent protein translocase protein TatA
MRWWEWVALVVIALVVLAFGLLMPLGTDVPGPVGPGPG